MEIQVKNTWFSHGETPTLKNITCGFKPGRFHTVIGPNGSGKTTLLDLISGFLPQDKGEIRIKNTPIHKIPKRDLARSVALVSQDYGVNFPFTVHEVVLMGRHPYINRFSHPTNQDLDMAESVMAQTGISHLKHRKITELSGGERQRCVFARALCQDTPVLLLDEAFSNMDISHTLHLLSILKQKVCSGQKTVIAVLHDLNLASAWSDHMILLKKGRIMDMGRTDQVFTRENIHAVFKVDAKVSFNDYTQAKQAYFKTD